jgi:predicted PurR-regulated permease PerM
MRPTPSGQEMEQAIFRALRKTLLLTVGVYLLFQFLGAVTFLILFFSVVLLLAAALNPAVAWLQKRRVPRAVSAAVLALAVLGGLIAGLSFAIPPLVGQGREFAEHAPELYNNLHDRLHHVLRHFPGLQGQLPATWDEALQRVEPYLNTLAGQAGRYALNVVAVIGGLLLMVVLVAYTLATPQPQVAGLLGVVPEARRGQAERILGLCLVRLKAWAIGSLILGLIMGIVTGVALQILGVPFALVFGVIAGFGELIPNFGPVIAAIPPILVALAQDPVLAFWVAVVFLVAQQLENWFLVPYVMGKSLDLHPVSLAFMMLVMGALFGVVGAIIAVPVAAILKTLYEELYLARQVRDPEALLAQSERVVADQSAIEEAAAATSVGEQLKE